MHIRIREDDTRSYQSTTMSFYLIRSWKRAKYATVLYCRREKRCGAIKWPPRWTIKLIALICLRSFRALKIPRSSQNNSTYCMFNHRVTCIFLIIWSQKLWACKFSRWYPHITWETGLRILAELAAHAVTHRAEKNWTWDRTTDRTRYYF